MRCTAPMKAPGPPPTMPSRKRRFVACFAPSIGIGASLSLGNAEHPTIGFGVSSRCCEIIECAICDLNDVPCNEWRTFFRALFAALQAALPLEDGPSVEIVLRKLRKNSGEIHLSITQRTKSP